MADVKNPLPRVQFETSLGNFVLELEAERTPLTVANFLQYVEDGFYEGIVFHRIIADFMIQGGGYTDVDSPKQKGLRDPIRNEAKQGIRNKRGTISMARTSDPHSATSQFFINVEDNDMLDPSPGSDGYCAFGTVVEGMDVVDKIKSVKVQSNPGMRGEQSLPVDAPVIVRVTKLAG